MNTKILLSILVCMAFLTACSVAPGVESATQAASPSPESVPVMPATASPTQTALPQANDSLSKPLAITVGPPHIPIGPEQGTLVPTPAGWQAYTSPALGVVVNYPVDWSVAASGVSVTFASPQGGTILLQTEITQPSATGQECTTLTNSYGQEGNICFDAATFSYHAAFEETTGDAASWLVLSTVSQERPTVFFQMFDSLRPAP